MEVALEAAQERMVSFSSSLDSKELVRRAIDIVELVGRYIQLRRQGRMFVGLCPWHDDRRPSLQVNPERQSFRCWVCNIGGDCFSFLQRIENITFPEALEMLAERAGIELKPAARESQPAAPNALDRRTLLQAAAWAENQYHQCLLESPEAEPARRYLVERGISAESIARFRLGFSPLRGDWLIERVDRQPQRLRILEAIGILARGESGPYDRFRGRLLFSIRDAQGRPVGLGGRLLPDVPLASQAKYVNSPETMLFNKSKLLYGLDLARDAIRRGGDALVMEGYTDVIAAHQCGIAQAVAVLGTALGPEHIRILKHYARRVILVLDGDAAGIRRAKEVLGLFLAAQVDLRVVTLPDDLDPCDYLVRYGGQSFERLIAESARDALTHAFVQETQGLDVERDVHAATEALERLLATIAQAPRLSGETSADWRLREEKALQRLAAFFRIDEAQVRQRLAALRRAARRRPVAPAVRPDAASEAEWGAASARPAEPLDAWRRELFELLVVRPEGWSVVRREIDADWLSEGPAGEVFRAACRILDRGQLPDYDRLMVELEDPAIKGLVVQWDEQGQLKQQHNIPPEELLREMIERFKYEEEKKRRPAKVVALREGQVDHDQGLALLSELLEQEKKRQGISPPKDG